MLAFCFAIFLVFGTVLVLVGANQDALAVALGIDLAESGLAASTLALGIGAGMALGGPLADRVARRPLAAVSMGVAAAALLGVSDGMSFARLLAHVFALGAGAGLANVLMNVVIVEHFGEAATRRLVVMHSAATLGAVAGPGLAVVLGQVDSWTLSFRVVGAAYGLFALWVLRVPLGVPAHARAGALPAARPRAPLELAAYCLTAFAYLGVEGGVTVFAVPFAVDGLGLSPDRGRAAISAFWLGLLAGRMSLLLWRGALDARVLVVCGVAGTAALALAALRVTAQVEWLFGGAGFCIGPVFPLLVALSARTLPAHPGLATGLVTGLGSLGAFVLPWATGAIGDARGVGAAFGALALGCAAMAGAATAARRASAPLEARPREEDRIGLCASCRHARRTGNRRGSEFWQCGLGDADASYRRYPQLPVRRCSGHELQSSQGTKLTSGGS